MIRAEPIVRRAGEGEKLWFSGGGVFTMKATSAETGGAFFALEDRLVRGKTTPLHIHPDEDDTVYVLDGEIVVHIDGHEEVLGKGGFFFAPRGVPHAFMVTSETAHILAWQTPGTGEAFYREISDPVGSDDAADRPPDIARLQAAAERSPSIVILGPPPFETREAPAVEV